MSRGIIGSIVLLALLLAVPVEAGLEGTTLFPQSFVEYVGSEESGSCVGCYEVRVGIALIPTVSTEYPTHFEAGLPLFLESEGFRLLGFDTSSCVSIQTSSSGGRQFFVTGDVICHPVEVSYDTFSVRYQPLEYGSWSEGLFFQETGGFLWEDSVPIKVSASSRPPYWEPNVLEIDPLQVYPGQVQHLMGEDFFPPPTGEYGETFVAYLVPGQQASQMITGTITSITSTDIEVVVPELSPGTYKIYVGWPLTQQEGWIVSLWTDISVVGNPTSVSLSAFDATPVARSLWILLAIAVLFFVGTLLFFLMRR